MVAFLGILTGLGMLITLGILFAGMLGLVRDDVTGEKSNKLMRWRVIAQGVTLVLFALLLAVSR